MLRCGKHHCIRHSLPFSAHDIKNSFGVITSFFTKLFAIAADCQAHWTDACRSIYAKECNTASTTTAVNQTYIEQSVEKTAALTACFCDAGYVAVQQRAMDGESTLLASSVN